MLIKIPANKLKMKVKINQDHKFFCPVCKKLNYDEDNLSDYDNVSCEFCGEELDILHSKQKIVDSEYAALKSLSDSNKITFGKK